MGEPDPQARRWISRDGIVAPDPLGGLSELTSEAQLSYLDDVVTARAQIFGLDSEAALEAQRERITTALRESWDPDRLRRAERLEREREASRQRLLRLHEELFVSTGTSRGRLPQPEREALIKDKRAALRDAAAQRDDIVKRVDVTDRGRLYSVDFFNTHRSELADLFAIERELVLREARAAAERGEPTAGFELPAGAKVNDLDLNDIAARASEQRAGERALPPTTGTATRPVRAIARADVPHPELFEGIGGALGERRTKELKTRAGPLARFAATQPDHSISTKWETIGSLPTGLDRNAARRAVRLESLSRVAQEQREQCLANVERFAVSDPERAAVEQRTAAWCEHRLGGYRQLLDQLHVDKVHPDQWLAANEDKLIVAAVYEREHTIRDRREVAQLVESAVAGHSRNPERVLGKFPETKAQQERWLELARPVEKLRIEAERAERLGSPPPDVDARALQALSRDIDRFRESQGMEPLAQAPLQPALERGGGPGFG